MSTIKNIIPSFQYDFDHRDYLEGIKDFGYGSRIVPDSVFENYLDLIQRLFEQEQEEADENSLAFILEKIKEGLIKR